MPITEHNNVSIPESITLGGVTYSVKDTPEIQQFIQAVSRVEKTKLYSQMDSLKQQIAQLGNVQIQPNDTQTQALIESLKGIFATKEDMKVSLEGVVKEVVQPLLSRSEEAHKNELAMYREQLIKQNEATCIPDLVKGNTKEELDASLQESIRLRAAYPAPVGTPTTQAVPANPPAAPQQTQTPAPQTPAPQQPAIPTPPPFPQRQMPEVTGAPNVKSMSMEEFAKQRENLQHQLESMYGGSSI